MSDNRRAFTRIPMDISVKLTHGEETVECETLNLSLSGILLQTSAQLPKGEACALTIKLGEGDFALELTTKGQIVRSEAEQVGVHFTEVDLESFHHLRQLILYNAEAPEEVEAEFGKAAGLKLKEDEESEA